MSVATVLIDALYLVVLINPISKISVLALFPDSQGRAELRSAATRASAVAYVILFGMALGGDLLLRAVFHVDLYSLQIAGGIVLFVVGFRALNRGVFYELEMSSRLSDISIVPLASPLIAGPATISAALSMGAEHGHIQVGLALLIAVSCNLGLMLLAGPIGVFLRRHNVMGALIRITGLVITTIGVQLMLDGVSTWLSGRAA